MRSRVFEGFRHVGAVGLGQPHGGAQGASGAARGPVPVQGDMPPWPGRRGPPGRAASPRTPACACPLKGRFVHLPQAIGHSTKTKTWARRRAKPSGRGGSPPAKPKKRCATEEPAAAGYDQAQQVGRDFGQAVDVLVGRAPEKTPDSPAPEEILRITPPPPTLEAAAPPPSPSPNAAMNGTALPENNFKTAVAQGVQYRVMNSLLIRGLRQRRFHGGGDWRELMTNAVRGEWPATQASQRTLETERGLGIGGEPYYFYILRACESFGLVVFVLREVGEADWPEDAKGATPFDSGGLWLGKVATHPKLDEVGRRVFSGSGCAACELESRIRGIHPHPLPHSL